MERCSLVPAQRQFPLAFSGSELGLSGGKGLPEAARGRQTRASPAAVAVAPPTCHLQRALGACDSRCCSARTGPPSGRASWLRLAPRRTPCLAPPYTGLGTERARKVFLPGLPGLASQQPLPAWKNLSYPDPDTQVHTQFCVGKDWRKERGCESCPFVYSSV